MNALTPIQIQARARQLRRRRQHTGGVMPTWHTLARPEQRAPAGDWRVWLILAGRGWGKTRTGAEWIVEQTQRVPRVRVIAPTFADARDVCVEGESGIATLHRDQIEAWNRSLGEIRFTNGAHCKLFSADEPERLRGPQSYADWYDELAAWRYAQDTWDMAMMGLRLGDDPRVCVTTTPRPIPLVRTLLAAPTTHVTRGSTYDNAANLAPQFLEQILARYEGTRLGRQELHALLLEETPGALWTRALIEQGRTAEVPALSRVVVSLDPPAGSDDEAAEAGIVVAGIGMCACKGRPEEHGFVLDDRSLRATPAGWARAAVAAYSTHHADRIIAERNNGGEMVEHTLRTISPAAPIETVWASRGKHTRAEPFSALYEQGKVHHVGTFAHLEDQMCSWVPGMDSPDRLDALVWALAALFPNVAQYPVTVHEPRRVANRWRQY